MKITKARLKEIIKEELERFTPEEAAADKRVAGEGIKDSIRQHQRKRLGLFHDGPTPEVWAQIDILVEKNKGGEASPEELQTLEDFQAWTFDKGYHFDIITGNIQPLFSRGDAVATPPSSRRRFPTSTEFFYKDK